MGLVLRDSEHKDQALYSIEIRTSEGNSVANRCGIFFLPLRLKDTKGHDNFFVNLSGLVTLWQFPFAVLQIHKPPKFIGHGLPVTFHQFEPLWYNNWTIFSRRHPSFQQEGRFSLTQVARQSLPVGTSDWSNSTTVVPPPRNLWAGQLLQRVWRVSPVLLPLKRRDRHWPVSRTPDC